MKRRGLCPVRRFFLRVKCKTAAPEGGRRRRHHASRPGRRRGRSPSRHGPGRRRGRVRMSGAGPGRGGSREEVGTAAGPMALREEEDGLSHIVGALQPRKLWAATPRRRRGSPQVRWSQGGGGDRRTSLGRLARRGCGGSWEEERNRRFSVSPGRRRGTSDTVMDFYASARRPDQSAAVPGRRRSTAAFAMNPGRG